MGRVTISLDNKLLEEFDTHIKHKVCVRRPRRSALSSMLAALRHRSVA